MLPHASSRSSIGTALLVGGLTLATLSGCVPASPNTPSIPNKSLLDVWVADSSFIPTNLQQGGIGVGGVVHSTSEAYDDAEDSWAVQLSSAVELQQRNTKVAPPMWLATQIGEALMDKAQDEYGDGGVTPATLEALRVQVPDVRYLVFGRIQTDEVKAKEETPQSSRSSRGDGLVHGVTPWAAGAMAPPGIVYPAQHGWHVQRVDFKLASQPRVNVKTKRGKYRPLRRQKSQSNNDLLGQIIVGAAAAILVDAIFNPRNETGKDSPGSHQAGGASRKDPAAVATRSAVLNFDVYDLRLGRSVWSASASAQRGLTAKELADAYVVDDSNPRAEARVQHLDAMLPPIFEAVANRLPKGQ